MKLVVDSYEFIVDQNRVGKAINIIPTHPKFVLFCFLMDRHLIVASRNIVLTETYIYIP